MSLKSLFAGWFIKKTIRSAPVTNYGVLKTRINTIVDLDLLQYIVNDELIVTNAPIGNLTVIGIGSYNINDNDIVNHYLQDSTGDDNFWIMEVSYNKQINEMFLFSQVDAIYPQTATEWSEVLLALKEHVWEFNDLEYSEVWFSQVHYTEIYEDTPTKEPHTVTSKLFRREYANNHNNESLYEYLYVAVEDESVVRVYSGLEINQSNVIII